MSSTFTTRIAAVSGFLAVALGAFGAHALKGTLELHGTIAIWQTAALYHLVHSVVLLVLAQRDAPPRAAFFLFAAGIVIFSGSLYALALTNVKWLGAITPFGGLSLLGGWLSVAWRKIPNSKIQAPNNFQ
ncbi:MAG TPA: DUF423 domain-containing protein [Chthoniobacteraceae bacterium]|nr:DUF423 domain-containing protein [Chthoniobacteraceae bacterium]